MQGLDIKKLDILENAIRDAGAYAKQMQSKVHRSYKADGSVLTEVDLEISHRILSLLQNLFPDCGIISEEETTERKEDAEYTFVLDPIDGTDVYSQGLPTFAIGLGILDKERRPVGAMISAPRFGIGKDELFIRLDPGSELYVDGELFKMEGNKDRISQITMGSKGQKWMDFTSFNGKVRTLGSSIIHLVCPALFPSFQACVNQPCYIWDIASAHAVLLKVGMDIVYADGSEFIYDDSFVIDKKPFKMTIYAGSEKAREELFRTLPLKNQTSSLRNV